MEPAEHPYESVAARTARHGIRAHPLRAHRPQARMTTRRRCLAIPPWPASRSSPKSRPKGAGRKGRSWIAAPGSALLMTTLPARPDPGNARSGSSRSASRSACAARCAPTASQANCTGPTICSPEAKKSRASCASRASPASAHGLRRGVGINVHRPPGADEAIDPPPAFCDDVESDDYPRGAPARHPLELRYMGPRRSRCRNALRVFGNAWPAYPSATRSSKTATHNPSRSRRLRSPTAVAWSSNTTTAARDDRARRCASVALSLLVQRRRRRTCRGHYGTSSSDCWFMYTMWPDS